MNVKELRDRLSQSGIELSESALTKYLAQQGIKAEQVNDVVFDAMVAELSPKEGAIATTKPSAPTKGKTGNRRSSRNQTTDSMATQLKGAIANAAQASNLEVEAMRGVVAASAMDAAERNAQEIVDIIRFMPVAVLNRVGELAQEEADNSEFFRAAMQGLTDSVFNAAPLQPDTEMAVFGHRA